MYETFLIGCCYYPEHWDAESLDNDIKKIKDLGFNTVRMGEFSWSMYEPQEGKYDFSFLVKAVEAAKQHGLWVILGTPTAAPPKWLTDKYPQVLCVDATGTAMSHGSRQQHNHTDEVYLSYCEKITEAMLQCFCGYDHVIGWQIDNELNCHRNESYADSDDIAFRKWLEKKYGTIEELNRAWGNRFWSQEFQDFSQIECQRKTTTYVNPSKMVDYYLFLSDSVVNYAAVQAKIIRDYMPGAFITHNGYFENIDYKKLTESCLDVLSYDCYPAFQEKLGIGMGRKVAYKLALTRRCSEKFYILEQQSGPGGQVTYMLPTPLPGQIRLWTYLSIAHGAVGMVYFRYRTALYGAEQLWYGIYDHDGQENYRSAEIRQITEEISRVGDLFLNHRQKNDVAIFHDYHNECADKVESFVKNDYWDIFMHLNRKNIHADFISASDDFDRYKVIIFPHVTIADEALSKKIEEYTGRGGVAILSARSGMKDQNHHYRPQKAPGVFRPLAGCCVDWFSVLPKYETQTVTFRGKEYAVQDYYELLCPRTGTAVGAYTQGFCKDSAAIVKNGNVYYIGFYARESADLYSDIIAEYVDTAPAIDEQVEEFVLDNYKLYLNHGNTAVALRGFDLLKRSDFDQIPPYGVVLVEL